MYVSHTTRNVSQCTCILYKKVTLHTEYILGLLFCLLNIGCIRYHDATFPGQSFWEPVVLYYDHHSVHGGWTREHHVGSRQ